METDDISNKGNVTHEDGGADHADKRRKEYEGVVLLGPHPAYRIKLFPIVIMSTRIQKMVQSEECWEQNVTIELLDCPGDHNVLKVVESFCNGITVGEDSFITHAVTLVDVCDFLCFETLCARVLVSLKQHLMKSWEHCLSTLATFDNSKALQNNKAFIVSQSCLLEYISAKSGNTQFEIDVRSIVLCNVKLLYELIDNLSPDIADSILTALAVHCKKFSNDVILIRLDMCQLDCLKRENLGFHRLCNLAESVDHTKISQEALRRFHGTLLEALYKLRPGLFDLAMQERIEKPEVQKEVTKLQNFLAILSKKHNQQSESVGLMRSEVNLARAAAVDHGELWTGRVIYLP